MSNVKDLRQVQAEKQQAEAFQRNRVENLIASIYVNLISVAVGDVLNELTDYIREGREKEGPRLPEGCVLTQETREMLMREAAISGTQFANAVLQIPCGTGPGPEPTQPVTPVE